MILFDKESTIIRGLVLNVLNSKFLVFSTLKTKKQTTGDVSSATKKKKRKKESFVTIPFYLKEKLFFFFNSPSSPLLSDSAFTSLSLSLSLSNRPSISRYHCSSPPSLIITFACRLAITASNLILSLIDLS